MKAKRPSPQRKTSRISGSEQHDLDNRENASRRIPSPPADAVEDPYSAHFHPSRFGRKPDGTCRTGGLGVRRQAHALSTRPMDDSIHLAFAHRPVMADEVVEALMPVPSGLVVDGTVGGGGHAVRILEAREDLRFLGLDRDSEAVAAASMTLAKFGDRAKVVNAGFENLDEEVDRHGDAEVVAVFLDLGVSSPQIDRVERGFSYRDAGPLDMRMDRSQTLTAADVVNTYDERRLAVLIARYGEERFARAIARRIIEARPLDTTEQLAELIKSVIPAPARRHGGHPAKRTFQAIRIEVNNELEHLESGLDAGFSVLVPKGRFAVLSYHSLEDRRVKHRFVDWSTGGQHPPGMPTKVSARAPRARLVTSRALRPGEDEAGSNRRSTSARLRVLEKLHVPEGQAA